MEKITTVYVGLDVHKDKIAIATADDGRKGVIQSLGFCKNDSLEIKKRVKKLSQKYEKLYFCYEAGPCGYGIFRLLKSMGYDCEVVAPSLIPKKAGDKVKTDRRDAQELARLHRNGDLTPVWVPDITHEAIRDLVRLRRQVLKEYTQARQQLLGFLLRNDKSYSGKSNWTKSHFTWMRNLKFENPTSYIVLQEYLQRVEDLKEKLSQQERHVLNVIDQWSLKPYVDALQSLRGVGPLSAVSIMAELGDITRFSSPRQMMCYAGLVCREYSSGDRKIRGSITKSGNRELRRMLTETAWSYHYPARVTQTIHKGLEGQSKAIRDISWKAQTRLSKKYKTLLAKGKKANVAIIGVARELLGFMWAIANVVQEEQMQKA